MGVQSHCSERSLYGGSRNISPLEDTLYGRVSVQLTKKLAASMGMFPDTPLVEISICGQNIKDLLGVKAFWSCPRDVLRPRRPLLPMAYNLRIVSLVLLLSFAENSHNSFGETKLLSHQRKQSSFSQVDQFSGVSESSVLCNCSQQMSLTLSEGSMTTHTFYIKGVVHLQLTRLHQCLKTG